MTNVGNNKETHDIMENSVYTPSEVLERIMQAGEKRILLPVVRCILLGMLAGAMVFIALPLFIIHKGKQVNKTEK